MRSFSETWGALRGDGGFNWRTFGILVLTGLLSTLAILPMQLYGQDLGILLWLIVVSTLLNTGILLVVAVGIGTFLHDRVGLHVHRWAADAMRRNGLASILGLLSRALIVGLDAVVFVPLVQDAIIGGVVAETPQAPFWTGFLAGFYGGITEELLLRFGLMTLLVWGGWKLTGSDGVPSVGIVWAAIVFAAVLFGLGHLPATTAVYELTPAVVVRAIILNGVVGIVFGWLYWRYDLTKAMVSHFSADMVLHVLLPTLFP
ncbi:CPBP family intramembrane glutamic endopeptidase [Halococcus salsus]|uniref:CPBP family intramembrane glutamic endopeptidase n=1 Tax=Halococcus salsus TaxID=2162894 RepID=UPI00135AA368|nr:CPBP family intramembrane glutamic endopeptidase [Halococcus salsus]